ncbi:MAG TPA: hypothetical protein PKC23_08665 [Candidatus Desulfobacillus sp.]|nr:hypothetical protein [Candidatus Desulfobacillus sp.]
MKRLSGLVLLAMLAPTLWAHGDEDHGTAAAVATAQAEIAPRAEALGEAFEVVAVLAGGRLTLYVDRQEDNSPVANAVVEVDSDDFKAVAEPIAPGEYAAPGEALSRPGRHPLAVSIQTAEAADLLATTLEVAAPPAGARGASWSAWAGWGGAAAALAATLAFVRRRRVKATGEQP